MVSQSLHVQAGPKRIRPTTREELRPGKQSCGLQVLRIVMSCYVSMSWKPATPTPMLVDAGIHPDALWTFACKVEIGRFARRAFSGKGGGKGKGGKESQGV